MKRRSQHWFGDQDKDGFIHRSWMKNQGLADDAFDGRPIIGICNTFSEFTPCNAHFRHLIEHIKAGLLPLEFPVISCGESNLRLHREQPLDAQCRTDGTEPVLDHHRRRPSGCVREEGNGARRTGGRTLQELWTHMEHER